MSADSQDQEASVSGQKRNKANSLRGRILSKVVKKRWTPVQRWSARISSLIHLEESSLSNQEMWSAAFSRKEIPTLWSHFGVFRED